MSKKLIKKMVENYDEENLKSLDEHIQKTSNRPAKPVFKMMVDHKGPTNVIVKEKSMKKLAKTVLDL